MPLRAPNTASLATPISRTVSAIVPARNEESVLATSIESIARQPEITEILVVDDQSTDTTPEIVRGLQAKIPQLRLLRTHGVPPGWVGKNNAVALGAAEAKNPWLLFTDADAELRSDAITQALSIARQTGAALVSFSPDQITQNWYEKALIPFVYCRLSKKFSFRAVNDPITSDAAANGQFMLIRREVYDAVGGHASVAAEILEDVALAKRVKAAGYRLWFDSGKGIVRVRMYRTFRAMWEGWRKNLYLLMGGTPRGLFREMESVFPWIPLLAILLGLKFPLVALVGIGLLIFRHIGYRSELARNQYPLSFIIYYVPAMALYTGVLWASYLGHASGKVLWKGREYPVRLPGTIR
jgi:cellulose synthase/poly-beta-1,6-N-acetylglucosamine synthase-like glycosyltransferase